MNGKNILYFFKQGGKNICKQVERAMSLKVRLRKSKNTRIGPETSCKKLYLTSTNQVVPQANYLGEVKPQTNACAEEGNKEKGA